MNRKPILVLKYKNDANGSYKIEVFNPYANIFIVHRHSLVEYESLSKILGFKRMFNGKFYCMQELLMFETEALQLIESFQSLSSTEL
jgi:hypothetical protein